MPNHVASRITVHGDPADIAAFRKRMFVTKKGEGEETAEELFDFNAVIPMPEALRNSEASTTAEFGAKLIALAASRGALALPEGIPPVWFDRFRADVNMPTAPAPAVARAYLKAHPEYEEKGRQRLRCITEHGHADWYGWSIENWGTKWNAYSMFINSAQPDPRRFSFGFDTAWSFPTPVFEAIARAFPKLRFECVCFDEGWNFAGTGWFNPADGEPAFAECEATDELHLAVYGELPERDEEDA